MTTENPELDAPEPVAPAPAPSTGTNALVGPLLEVFREQARVAVMNHFVRIAESDNRPPTQRAMDSVKLQEAYRVQAGQPSSLITREAARRGLSEAVMAAVIIGEGQKAFDIELRRVDATLEIDVATDYLEVLQVLDRNSVVLRTPGA